MKNRLALALGFGLALGISALCAPLDAQDAQTSWTITVDCTAGQSINSALAQAAPDLIIEVRGECRENVVVRRDNVTLRGVDPQRDGIRSPGIGEAEESTVLIRDARRISIENLRVSGGPRDGVRVLNSHDEIVISNSRFESNGVWGASIADSTVEIRDSTFTGNAVLVVDSIGGGLMAARGSDVFCANCTVELNPESGANLGAVSFAGSTLRFSGSRVTADTAVLAQSYSRALIDSTELTGATWSFQANQYGTVRITEGTLSGPFLGKGYSTVELLGTTQVLNQLQNFVTESSSLIADRRATGEADTTLAGLTLVADYSNGRLVNGTAVESLMCGLGGDVFCDGTVLTPGATGCKSCP